MSSETQFTEVEELERKLSIAKLQEQIDKEKAELGERVETNTDWVGIRTTASVSEPDPEPEAEPEPEPTGLEALSSPKNGKSTSLETLFEENSKNQLNNRLVSKKHTEVVNTANQGIKKPVKGNKKKTSNPKYSTSGGPIISKAPAVLHSTVDGDKIRKHISTSRFSWFTVNVLLDFMQESKMNCFKNSFPVIELTQAICRDQEIGYTESFRDCVRGRLKVLEKKGLVVNKEQKRVKKLRFPILPKDYSKEGHDYDDKINPVVLQWRSYSPKVTFWYLSKKGAKL